MTLRHLLLTILTGLALATPVQAHVSEGFKEQTLLLWIDPSDGLTAYLRLPAPFLFSDVIAEAQAKRIPLASPFVWPAPRGAYAMGVPDDAQGLFAERMAGAIRFRADGTALATDVTGWRLLPDEHTPPPDASAAARAAVASAGVDSALFDTAYLELLLTFGDPRGATGALGVALDLPPLQLAPGVVIETRVIDLRGPAKLRTLQGQLTDDIALPPAAPTWHANSAVTVASGLALLTGLAAFLAARRFAPRSIAQA